MARYYSSTNHPPIESTDQQQQQQQQSRKDREEYDDDKQDSHHQVNDAKQEQINKLRIQILDASLPFVSSYGWTRKTLERGAESIGYGSVGIAHGIFEEGGIELIRHFNNKCNNELVEILKEKTKNNHSTNTNTTVEEIDKEKQLEFMIDAIKIRLQMIEPYLPYWPQALAIMSLPQNVPKSLAQLLTLVDDICYYSGDRSVDFEWYTRRIKVATIFKLTETYMLQDSSMNHEETWQFLKRRMEEITNIEAILSTSQGLTKNVQHKLISTFETARNILGLDYNRR